MRAWMQIDRETFYDESRIAIIPMGFCYPGRDPRGGDRPPRVECAEHWLDQLLARLPRIEFAILAGQYAHRHYLRDRIKLSLSDTVRAWREYYPRFLPIPHPSPRNTLWLKRHPWFELEVVPALRERVAALLRGCAAPR